MNWHLAPHWPPTAYTDTLDLTYDAVDRVTRIVDSKAGTLTRQYDNFN